MLSLIDTRPFPAVPTAFNMAGHVLSRGHSLPDKAALVILHPDRDEVFSYRQITAMVLGCASALRELGLNPGDRVLMRLQSSSAFPVVFLGAIAAGLVPVATSSVLTGPEITRLAALVAPRLIVAEPGVTLPDHTAPVIAADPAGWALQPAAEFHQGDAGREGYFVFTSGSSGQPEAVSHAHRAILARAAMHDAWEGLGTEDRLLHAGALNWTYTLGTGLLDPWTVGATALIPAAGTLPADLPALLAKARATVFAAAPGVFRQMLRTDLPALPHLRHALSAGEAMPDALRAEWHLRTGTDVHEALGMSELSTYVSGSPDRPAPPETAGFVQPGRLVACLGDDGRPVPCGTPGELAVSTADPGFMRGYLGRPTPAGPWFRTGDIAVMAETGAISLLGRKDDLMTAGGFRVSPVDVEAAFDNFPGLTACAAAEVEVAPGTRIIALFYEGPCGIEAPLLHQRAENLLARWKQPRHYQRLETLPRTANGKLIRRALAPLFQRPDL
ncbi:MAG: benzoate--CoA ligase [Rhodobacter sp.]|nr:benzoate--CoA ligase [Rhodobacter sp.]